MEFVIAETLSLPSLPSMIYRIYSAPTMQLRLMNRLKGKKLVNPVFAISPSPSTFPNPYITTLPFSQNGYVIKTA